MLLGPKALFGLMQLIRDSMSAGVVGEHLLKKSIRMICNKFSICCYCFTN